MKVLFMISHPAHFHIFKNVFAGLQNDRHEVIIVIRPKDILEQLCVDAGVSYIKVKSRPKKSGFWRLGWSLFQRTIDVCKIVKRERPDFMIGSDGVIAVAGKLYGIPSFELFDDDYEIIKLYANIFFPLYTGVIAPRVTDAGKYTYKKIEFEGYKKLAYLWPSHFTPSREVVESYGIDTQKPYFVIRFAKLTAHHDQGAVGFSSEVAQHVIDILAPHGKIYITSERELEPQFEQYRIKINPLDIHHVMAFAAIYIGDSQTMACEAGILGTPFVRFNDFVGRINYMSEMEDVYELGYGIHATPLAADSLIKRTDGSEQPSGNAALYATVERLVAMDAMERRALYTARREKMLADKIDCAAWLTWLIENYPESVEETRKANVTKDEKFWGRFK